jgi:hypothetical protein
VSHPCEGCSERNVPVCEGCERYAQHLASEARLARHSLLFFVLLVAAILAIPLTLAAWGHLR